MDDIDVWLSTGEAAKRAGRDKRTIRRWADNGQVVCRKTPSGHRQIAASSLDAVLNAGRGSGGVASPLAGRLMLERWAAEAGTMGEWVPPRKTSQASLFALQRCVAAVRRTLDEVEGVIEFEIEQWADADVE